jgi:hypothetical protein
MKRFFKNNNSKMSKKETKEAIDVIRDFNTMLGDENGNSDLKLLEIRSLRTGVALSKQALINLKNEFKRNIFYILVGGLIGFISSYMLLKFQSKSEERIIELSKLLNEKNESKVDFQKHLNDTNIELLSLKKEIDSLKYKLKNEKR